MVINQCARLLNYLMRHGSITPAKARKKCGIQCLSARVCELRAMGIVISLDGDTYHMANYRKPVTVPTIEADDLFPEYTEEIINNIKTRK